VLNSLLLQAGIFRTCSESGHEGERTDELGRQAPATDGLADWLALYGAAGWRGCFLHLRKGIRQSYFCSSINSMMS